MASYNSGPFGGSYGSLATASPSVASSAFTPYLSGNRLICAKVRDDDPPDGVLPPRGSHLFFAIGAKILVGFTNMKSWNPSATTSYRWDQFNEWKHRLDYADGYDPRAFPGTGMAWKQSYQSVLRLKFGQLSGKGLASTTYPSWTQNPSSQAPSQTPQPAMFQNGTPSLFSQVNQPQSNQTVLSAGSFGAPLPPSTQKSYASSHFNLTPQETHPFQHQQPLFQTSQHSWHQSNHQIQNAQQVTGSQTQIFPTAAPQISIGNLNHEELTSLAKAYLHYEGQAKEQYNATMNSVVQGFVSSFPQLQNRQG
ncbi:hypothetical protein BT63DRAFT_471059 [Microthyrium microscopicum]|uniref:Uncharacterized protein n=1 Tax=Microthyrium microscopicum TaxID=703497 RepID=A0A6A6UDU4_9PEZI|nr:hypothetical protein BT63DRAFT_471059 [Microthyrium microscopicum]